MTQGEENAPEMIFREFILMDQEWKAPTLRHAVVFNPGSRGKGPRDADRVRLEGLLGAFQTPVAQRVRPQPFAEQP